VRKVCDVITMCAGDFQATPTKFTERAKSIDTLNYVRQVRMEKGKTKISINWQ